MAPAQIVLFGATGDLARRKLFPALTELAREHAFSVVGVARHDRTDESFRNEMTDALPEGLRAEFRDHLAGRTHYQQGDVESEDSLAALEQRLEQLGPGRDIGRLFYLSLAPELFSTTVSGLARRGLLEAGDGDDHPWRRVVLEKPFGVDLESARTLNREIRRALDEEQIYRIDHYLGKETVQNLLGFRFHNAIFEPLWNRRHVELVQINVVEQQGVEPGRSAYYESAGALRDVVQNHLLQVLALAAMEPPATLASRAIRERKIELLRSLRRPAPAEVSNICVRARYGPGEIDGEKRRGYLDDVEAGAGSHTETYVALRAEIENERWRGVPFLLRHGKALARRFTDVVVQFRTPSLRLFSRPEEGGGTDDCRVRPNRLRLRLQPDEAIELSFGVKEPGTEIHMTPATLAFDYRARFGAPPPAYERLLLDALRGDPTLFLHAEEVETAWRFVDAVRDGWRRPTAPPLLEYPAGSWGPPEADALFGQCEGDWSRG